MPGKKVTGWVNVYLSPWDGKPPVSHLLQAGVCAESVHCTLSHTSMVACEMSDMDIGHCTDIITTHMQTSSNSRRQALSASTCSGVLVLRSVVARRKLVRPCRRRNALTQSLLTAGMASVVARLSFMHSCQKDINCTANWDVHAHMRKDAQCFDIDGCTGITQLAHGCEQ